MTRGEEEGAIEMKEVQVEVAKKGEDLLQLGEVELKETRLNILRIEEMALVMPREIRKKIYPNINYNSLAK